MNRRKNRGASNRSPRTRSIPTEGVYNNPHFMHAATRLIGNVVRIQTASGKVWEGVFRTFSSQLDIVLEVAACVENPDSSNATLVANSLVDKLIFKACDIISMDAKDVDLEFATRDTFKTDTAISARTNGQHIRSEEKELEPWDPPVGVNGGDTSLELEPGANGWDAMDMFRKNEEIYGVQSTYDNTLTGYTVQLQKSDTPDYREREALAQQLANEIESQPAYKQRIEMENGDEETLYAAVHRPNQENSYSKPSSEQQNSSSGKYVPPAKRKNPTAGKLMRSTPPPSQSGSTQTTPSPKGNPPPLSYPTQHPSPNQPPHPSPNQQSQPPPQQQQQHREPPLILRDPPPPAMTGPHPMHQPPPPPPSQSMPPPVPNHGRPHSHTPPHPAYAAQMQARGGGGVGGGGGQGQGPPLPLQASNGHKSVGGGQQMNGEVKPPPPQSVSMQQQQQAQGGGLSRPPRNVYAASPNSAPPPMMVAPSMYQDVQGGPKPDAINCVPGRHREEVKELHKFSQDFKLASHMGEQGLPPPNQMGPPEQMGPPQPPSIVQKSHPTQQSTPPQQQQPPSNIQQQQQQPQQSVSPQQQQQQDAMDKVTNTLKQSKLNPNAKEFVLNPTAKPFTPRSPSTPTASRPHTPQTPSNPYVPPVLSGPPGQPQMPMMMSMGYMMTSQPQYQQQPQNNRFRKLPVGQIRADMTQMQVAAATGQPLLAPAPIPQFQIYQGLNPQTAYQQMHAVRMYESPPQLQYIPSNPSNAPSPAQPPPYTPGGQGPPPQPQQYPAAPPQGHPQFQMMCPIIQTQPAAMMQASMHYLQQPPPGGAPIQVIVPHPQQQHGPTP